jgi:hypothetical protein
MSSGGRLVCAECGSIRTRRISGNPWQRVVAVLRRQEVIVCGRCGWRGRQYRLDEKSRTRPDGAAVESQSDTLDYQALDQAMTTTNDAPIQPGHRS